MATDNHVTVIGNVTRDPELKFIPNGQALCSFGLAVNRRTKAKGTDDWQEETSFFDVVAWSQLGENVSSSIVKGSRVIVDGRLQQRSWETDAGDKRSKVEIVADDVGAALRWAEAVITRNERKEGGGHQRNDPGPTEPAYDPNEEPF